MPHVTEELDQYLQEKEDQGIIWRRSQVPRIGDTSGHHVESFWTHAGAFRSLIVPQIRRYNRQRGLHFRTTIWRKIGRNWTIWVPAPRRTIPDTEVITVELALQYYQARRRTYL